MEKSARKGAGDRGDKMVTTVEMTSMCTCRFCANCESVEVDFRDWTCPMCDAELDVYSECFGQCGDAQHEEFSMFMNWAGVEGDDERLFMVRKDSAAWGFSTGETVVWCEPVDLPRLLGPDDEWRQQWKREDDGALSVVQYHHDAPVGESFTVRELVLADASAFEPFADYFNGDKLPERVMWHDYGFRYGLREAFTQLAWAEDCEAEACEAWENVYEDPYTMWAKGLLNYVYMRGVLASMSSIATYDFGYAIGRLLFTERRVDERVVDRAIAEFRWNR